MRAHRSQPLGRRIDIDDGVRFPRASALFVGVASPQIDDGFTVERDGDRRANLAGLLEIVDESLLHALEAPIAIAVDLGRHLKVPRCVLYQQAMHWDRALNRSTTNR